MNMLINKTLKWLSAVLAAAVLLGSCSKDENPVSLTLSTDAVLLDALGQTGVVHFSTENVAYIKLNKIPKGWTATEDFASRTITVTAPAQLDITGTSVRSGNISVVGYSYEGSPVTKLLFVAVANKKDLADQQSNSFIISEPFTNYTFDATLRGETTSLMPTADVRIIWQTNTEQIKYPKFDNGKYSFYVDGTAENKLKKGNVLLGAYNGAGELLATWHLWIVEADDVKEQTYANGKTFMSLNLGALGNTNKTHDEILASFGLFYQWGRQTPFVGPNTYDAAKAEDHYLYDAEGKRITLSYVASTAETGTAAYAAANPMVYLLGVEASGYDWLYSAHTDGLWADKKTESDPCPKGWRVPSKSDFGGLQIDQRSSGRADQFGWNLTDGTVTAYYPGAGFRPYLTGRIQNVYNPIEGVEVPKPWIGYYWTNGTEGVRSSSMFFWFSAVNVMDSGIELANLQYRANGMQVRCVRE